MLPHPTLGLHRTPLNPMGGSPHPPWSKGADPEAVPMLPEPQVPCVRATLSTCSKWSGCWKCQALPGGASASGGSSGCFGFHSSALIFRALQFGQTNISRVHGESMQCSSQEIVHLSPLSEAGLQTGINKSFIVLHHRNTPKTRGKKMQRVIYSANVILSLTAHIQR